MTAFDYSGLVTKAQALIEKFGQALTITSKTTTAQDAVAGTVTQSTSTQSAYGVLFDFTGKDAGQVFADETVVERADKKCLVSGVSVTLDSTVTVGGVVYRVLNIKELNPGGTRIYYELWLKK